MKATTIAPGNPAWLHGQPVTVRLVCMGARPYTAWLTDGRRIPVAELTSLDRVLAEARAVGW